MCFSKEPRASAIATFSELSTSILSEEQEQIGQNQDAYAALLRVWGLTEILI
jgi:hypothetical protein